MKRELKLRGLSTTGNKMELVDRLQTVLIDGELSLEDSADLLDDDAVLTDEDEAHILGSDENDLLKSPSPVLKQNPAVTVDENAVVAGSHAKKIVLKRKSSFTSITTLTADANSSNTSKDNTELSPPKTLKMSERNPITMDDGKQKPAAVEVAAPTGVSAKVAQLSMQERLEMRAKKFGITANAAAKASSTTTATVGAATTATPTPVAKISDEKQLEILKKRADRFGCVVSPKIAKVEANEKLQKRKERFGLAAADTATNNNTTTATAVSTEWSEKARMRLERFQTTPAARTGTAATTTTT